MPPSVSLVIPCYDEEGSVDPLVAVLDPVVAGLAAEGRRPEVIVVDDGSRDGTFARLRAAAATRPWLRLVRFRRNFGQTAALAAGFERARGDVIVSLDADLENDPRDVPSMLERIDAGFDVVSGWRRERWRGAFFTRRLPSYLANWIIGRVGGLRLHDYGCTLKAYRREVLATIHLYGEMHRFVPLYARWAGAEICELEVRYRPRQAGRSKYGLGRTIKVVLDLLTVKFLQDFSTKPLYLFGGAGSLLCLGGVAAAAWALYQKLAHGAWIHRNPLALVAMMLVLLGAQMILMGLLAELQVRTYHESQGKKTYVLRETYNLDAPDAAARAAGGHPPAPA